MPKPPTPDDRARDGFDPRTVRLDDLRVENPERLIWSRLWPNFRLVYRGGEEFKRAAADKYTLYSSTTTEAVSRVLSDIGWGNKPGRRFLHQMEGEPDNAYERRWERSVYLGYVGPIIDYFTGWLFSQPPVIRPAVEEAPAPEAEAPTDAEPPQPLEAPAGDDAEGEADDAEPKAPQPEPPAFDGAAPDLAAEIEAARAEMGAEAAAAPPPPAEMPPWWNAFSEDCDGAGTRFDDFVRDAFRDIQQTRYGGWLVATREAPMMDADRAEQMDLDADIRLIYFGAEQILDWSRDEAGRLEWVVLRRVMPFREFPRARMQVETFYYVDRQAWHLWTVQTPQQQAAGGTVGSVAQGSQTLTYVDGGEHGAGEVPFRWFEVPHGLWVMNKLYAAQVNLYNQVSMLLHGQLLGAYLQPVLKTNEEGASSRVFGEGTLVRLRAGGGGQNAEEFSWVSANTAPLTFNADQIKAHRDEMYRVVHQMAMAVDATAVKDLSRSGESKKEDRRATEVVLNAFGGIVRDAMRGTLRIIARMVGDGTRFNCVGYDSFEVSDLADEIQNAIAVASVQIPSPTFRRVILTQLATGRLVAHLDEPTKATIADEIAEAVERERESELMQPPPGADPFGDLDAGADPNAPPADDVDALEGASEGEPAPDAEAPEDPDLAAELEEARAMFAGGGGEVASDGKRRRRRRRGKRRPDEGAPEAPPPPTE